jgi:hypothetical protein
MKDYRTSGLLFLPAVVFVTFPMRGLASSITVELRPTFSATKLSIVISTVPASLFNQSMQIPPQPLQALAMFLVLICPMRTLASTATV